MPLPILICLALASGLAAALADRDELRVSPRPSLLTRGFGAYTMFVALLFVPVGVYFYVFHGDWFLLYSIDAQRIPSAVALVGFLVLASIGSAGFAGGASLVRAQRESWVAILAALTMSAAVVVIALVPHRISKVGTFTQFHGGFGLKSFQEGTLLQGTLVMGALLFVGFGSLLLRLHRSRRRG